MENEIIEMVEAEDVIVAEEGKGLGTGVAMAIGAGITFAGIAIVKLVKKGIDVIKAKAEAKKQDEHDFCVEPDETK